MSHISMPDAEAFKANVTIIHDALVAKGSYDLGTFGLCYAITHAGGRWSCEAYSMMGALFTELHYQDWIEHSGVFGPKRLGLICFLNALSAAEIYEIANSEVTPCPQ